MELPIRCFSCNKVLGNKWETVKTMHREGAAFPQIWDRIRVTRECCRFVVQTTVQSVGEEMYEYTNGGTIPVRDIGTDVIDTRRRQKGVVTVHRAV